MTMSKANWSRSSRACFAAVGLHDLEPPLGQPLGHQPAEPARRRRRGDGVRANILTPLESANILTQAALRIWQAADTAS